MTVVVAEEAPKKRTRGPAKPFSVGHFRKFAKGLILDNGKPWTLEPFQADFLEDVFAGYPVCWLIIPEGNTKTTMLAGLGLYGLRYGDDPLIPIAASSRDQTKIMYRQAKGFVRRSREHLDEENLWFECFDGYRRIDLRTKGRSRRGEVVGSIEVHAADAGTADGIIYSPYAFLDELHRQDSLELYETWRGKREKRNAQLVGISTAGEPGSDFEESRAKIREAGTTTVETVTFKRIEHPRILLHEHAVPENGDPHDYELVSRANPASFLTAAKLEEKHSDPTMSEPHWLRFNCNIAAFTGDIELFVPLQDWDRLADGDVVPENAVACLGADGSRTWDTTVIAWASPAADGRIDVDARVFSVRPDQPYHALHMGGKIDFDDVENFILDRFDYLDLRQAGYDPRYLERSMEIVDRRLMEACIFAVEPQSKHMRDALQSFYRSVAEGKLRHRGDSVIRSHIENSKVDRDERSQEIRRIGKIDRRKAIDAVPAMAMAVWRAEKIAGQSGEFVPDYAELNL